MNDLIEICWHSDLALPLLPEKRKKIEKDHPHFRLFRFDPDLQPSELSGGQCDQPSTMSGGTMSTISYQIGHLLDKVLDRIKRHHMLTFFFQKSPSRFCNSHVFVSEMTWIAPFPDDIGRQGLQVHGCQRLDDWTSEGKPWFGLQKMLFTLGMSVCLKFNS